MAHIVAKRFWRCRVLIPLDLSFLPTCSTDLYRSQIWIRFAPCLRNFGRSVGRPGLECQCFVKCQRQRRIDRMDRMDRMDDQRLSPQYLFFWYGEILVILVLLSGGSIPTSGPPSLPKTIWVCDSIFWVSGCIWYLMASAELIQIGFSLVVSLEMIDLARCGALQRVDSSPLFRGREQLGAQGVLG
jgi:hypothetical protein